MEQVTFSSKVIKELVVMGNDGKTKQVYDFVKFRNMIAEKWQTGVKKVSASTRTVMLMIKIMEELNGKVDALEGCLGNAKEGLDECLKAHKDQLQRVNKKMKMHRMLILLMGSCILICLVTISILMGLFASQPM